MLSCFYEVLRWSGDIEGRGTEVLILRVFLFFLGERKCRGKRAVFASAEFCGSMTKEIFFLLQILPQYFNFFTHPRKLNLGNSSLMVAPFKNAKF